MANRVAVPLFVLGPNKERITLGIAYIHDDRMVTAEITTELLVDLGIDDEVVTPTLFHCSFKPVEYHGKITLEEVPVVPIKPDPLLSQIVEHP